jgi:hypothetical protein
MHPGLLSILVTKIFFQELLRAVLTADDMVALAELVSRIEWLTAETFRRHVHHKPVIHVATNGVATGTITRDLQACSHGNFLSLFLSLHTSETFIHQPSSNQLLV